MLSRKFIDSRRTVAELQQQMRDLQEQQIPHVSAAMCSTCKGYTMGMEGLAIYRPKGSV